MKTEKKNIAARLEFFRSLYENAKNLYAENLDRFDKYMRQYKGSHEIDGGKEDALTVRNITYEIIESQISSELPMPKADADSYSEKRERQAQIIETLCKSLRNKLPFEEYNDLDERYTYIYGGSVWLVEWNNSLKLGGVRGGADVRVISPKNFIPQPNIFDIENMEYCFLKFITTRTEVKNTYGIKDEDIYSLECESDEGFFDGGDTVSIIVCFFKDEKGEVGKFVFSGSVTLLDLENYYKRKIKVCKKCGKSDNLCLCEGKPSFIMKDIEFEFISSGEGESLMKIPYYTPKRFPIVIRKNTSAEDSLLGQSDCEYIRPEQQAINKVESRILQKLLRAGITPIVPEDASITLNNSVFGQVIKMKPGESMAQYGKVDTTPDISQDITEAERLYEHSKRILGITDAYQGIGGNANESGYARQLRISQSGGRLESKKKMKYTAYANIDSLIFEHYLAFADEPMTLSYKDPFGRIHDLNFNRYEFISFNPAANSVFYDDGYLFSADVGTINEYTREAIWEKNLENLKAGTLGDPADPKTLLRYWQYQERAHYPNARDNVEYFLELMKGGGEFGIDENQRAIY